MIARPRRIALTCAILAAAFALTSPGTAKDSLGIFANWAAFRDSGVPRCYAIAKPQASKPRQAASRDYVPFATIASWPKRSLRNQVHFRLSHKLAQNAAITLTVGRRRFAMTGGGGDAWAKDKTADAAIVAAMRSAKEMRISARNAKGRRFSDSYLLDGAASAIDAAVIGCAKLPR